jgi:hypothetical protein
MNHIRAVLPVLCAILFLGNAASAQSDAGLDKRAARKVSDAYMAELVANRISNAIDMADSGATGPARKVIRSQYREILEGCGRPLDNKIENNGIPLLGENISFDGRKRTTLIFQYRCKTTHQEAIFSVTTSKSEDSKYHFDGLSCGKASPPAPTPTK